MIAQTPTVLTLAPCSCITVICKCSSGIYHLKVLRRSSQDRLGGRMCWSSAPSHGPAGTFQVPCCRGKGLGTISATPLVLAARPGDNISLIFLRGHDLALSSLQISLPLGFAPRVSIARTNVQGGGKLYATSVCMEISLISRQKVVSFNGLPALTTHPLISVIQIK